MIYSLLLILLIIVYIDMSYVSDLHRFILGRDYDYNANFVKNYIVNPHNFSYLLNPNDRVCDSPDVNILAYIHSSPHNFRSRQFVRETWSNKVLFPNLRTVFMMGTTDDSRVNKLLKYEYEQFGDIVQENFVDTYRNLTYKAIMAQKWIKSFCSNVKFIVKLDEDILMNTYALLDYFDELKMNNFKREKTILCYRWIGAMINRNKESKWYVKYDELKGDIYIDYCAGAAYIFTPDLPSLYFNLSLYVPFFWIDDYYLTGQLRNYTNTQLMGIESKFIMRKNEEDYFVTEGKKIIFGHFSKKIDDYVKIWKKILDKYQIKLSDAEIMRNIN